MECAEAYARLPRHLYALRLCFEQREPWLLNNTKRACLRPVPPAGGRALAGEGDRTMKLSELRALCDEAETLVERLEARTPLQDGHFTDPRLRIALRHAE